MRVKRNLRCAAEGCEATQWIAYGTKREYREDAARAREWRCLRHRDPGLVLRPDTGTIITERTIVALPSTKFPSLAGLYWHEEGESSESGFDYGPYWRAWADDFPEGAEIRFRTTIEVVLRETMEKAREGGE